jgi:hypothetical protein
MNILDREELSDEMENKNIQCRKSSKFITYENFGATTLESIMNNVQY